MWNRAIKLYENDVDVESLNWLHDLLVASGEDKLLDGIRETYKDLMAQDRGGVTYLKL